MRIKSFKLTWEQNNSTCIFLCLMKAGSAQPQKKRLQCSPNRPGAERSNNYNKTKTFYLSSCSYAFISNNISKKQQSPPNNLFKNLQTESGCLKKRGLNEDRCTVLTHLDVAERREPHLPGAAPAGGQQGASCSIQSCQADGGKVGAEAQEEAEGGGHDGRVVADQEGVQQGQDVEELLLRLGPVAPEDPQNLTLTPNVALLQPDGEHTLKRKSGDYLKNLGSYGWFCSRNEAHVFCRNLFAEPIGQL